ncbi:unnamed protein product [Callosobruchus maculatus]|uniref:Myosin tail domain-containing protein n=1 Tax=Callosobruchus maculatus TaxID=64391 RepID=A0A653BZI2_CALMS|nr:unnamed protein product [Callosobruchus maculatus]
MSKTERCPTKPLIRKIYDAPRKWLGTEKKDKQCHTYENVIYKNNDEKKKKDVAGKRLDAFKVVTDHYEAHSDKLKIVIDNFDKILDEYHSIEEPSATSTPVKPPVQKSVSNPTAAKKDTKIPKLVKAKTCSIIESKCILKKSISNPIDNTPPQSELQNKTKSLCNINRQGNESVTSETRCEAGETRPGDNVNGSGKKVKEIIERINSLSATDTPSKESDTFAMSKAKSTVDLSANKRTTVAVTSKIPVNTTLRKTYPSIPCDLHSLDLDRSSADDDRRMNGKLAKSTQNLTQFRMSLPKSDDTTKNSQLHTKLAKSTQNLTQYRMSLPKCDESAKKSMNHAKSIQNLSSCKVPIAKDIDKRSADLMGNKLTKSVQNLTQSKAMTFKTDNVSLRTVKAQNDRMNGTLAKSVQNLAQSKTTLPKLDSVITKSTQNLTQTTAKLTLSKNQNVKDNKALSKSVQNISKMIDKPSSNKSVKITNTKTVEKVATRDYVKVEAKVKTQPPKVLDEKSKQKEIANQGTYKVVKIKSKDVVDSNVITVKPPLARSDSGNKTTKEIEIVKTKPAVGDTNLTKQKVAITKSDCVDKVAIDVDPIKVKEDRIKSVIQKFEEAESVKPCGKPKLLKDGTYKIPLGNKITPVTKPLIPDPKKDKVTVTSSGTYKKPKPDTIKLNLQTAKDFLDKIKVETKDDKKYYFDPQHFLDDKVEKVINYLKEDSKSVKTADVGLDKKKHLDYNSDNSDDSGNISNEIELDCDDTHSSSSIKSSESLSTVLDVSVAEKDSGVDLSKSDVSTGKGDQIFFRTGALSRLESERDDRLCACVTRLQARCRGHLARRRLARRRLQETAVRCIQRNVRRFVAVRDWPWWRLLVRLQPLLDVHRTEQQLRARTEELETIKQKLEKIENERTKLKHENDKLEAKLSEMTADLAEEHSTATLAAERLDAETSERLKLEKELTDVQSKNRELQQASERLEMELLYARSDLNGISEEDEEGDGESGGVYKQRYERAVKELEFTRRRLQQQHEDDLEQLVGLKKQLEKKLADAYEEVEEQRQVVGQWKRKVQKLNGEMNDLRLLLEEQNGRNNLLEKKQRKFDSETQMLQDELKKERQAKERFAREKEVCIAEKYAVETALSDTRLELELKEEKLLALQREFDEVTCGGKTEEEVTVLRRQKIDLERRMQDQEEELDELAGQVQLLEQAKLRLEMTLEQMRKEAKKEAHARDEELEDVRCNAQKKVKALEQQLENEHEERTLLLREKHELERRLAAAAESERQDRAGDEALLHRLKKDVKRTKALLRDTQAQLERQKAETPGKAMIRQLRNQVEDLECARAAAVKAKQSLETELLETQSQLEEANKLKQEAEERVNLLQREKADLQTQLEENEEELAEVLKKFKGTVQQMSLDQMALQEQVSLVSELEIERNHLKEQLAELTSKLESAESMGDASSNLLVKRSELKVKELESKLELEQTTRSRLEVQITRLKEAVDKAQNDTAQSRVKEQQAQDQIRKLQRQLRKS